MNRPLIVIFAAVLIDSIGIGLIFPILPRLLTEMLPADGPVALTYGVVLALYAAMQFIFSPVMGVLSDRFGRRPVLLLSLAGAAVDYVLMAVAPALWMLVVGRAVAGLTSANMATATAYITDITAEPQRPQRFGWFNAVLGTGFIVGPVLGGFLGDLWIRAPFAAAALLNAANFALALFVLPESRPGRRTARFALAQLNPLRPLVWIRSIGPLVPLIAIWFVFNLTGQVYGTCWALWGTDAFGWNGLWIGLSLGAFGFFQAVAQITLPGPIAGRFGERRAMLIGIACEGSALAVTAAATQPWVVFAIMPLYALGGVGVPALQSLMTRQVSPDRQGELQGVLASIVSLASIGGPLLYSGLYFALAPIWPGLIWFAGLAVYVCSIPLILSLRRRPDPAIAV
jgi:DHA1 family tetracycline resistance protein-like MFS transporter